MHLAQNQRSDRSWGLNIAAAGRNPRIGIRIHIYLDPILFCGGVQGKVKVMSKVRGDTIVSVCLQVVRVLVVRKR